MIGGRRRDGPYSCKDRDPFLILGPSETPVTASHSLPAIDLSRCVLRTISQDGAFVVCRGAQPATSREPASVLVVMPRTEHPRPECVQMLEHEYALRADLDPTWAVRPLRARPASGAPVPGPRRSRRRAAGAETGNAADGARTVLAARRRSGRGARRTAPPRHHPQGPDAGSRHDRRGDGAGVADRFPHRVAPAARAPDAGAARGDRGHAALHGARTDGADEPLDRFAQRSLLVRRHSVRDGDRDAAIYRVRSDGMGALPHGPAARPASRTRQ